MSLPWMYIQTEGETKDWLLSFSGEWEIFFYTDLARECCSGCFLLHLALLCKWDNQIASGACCLSLQQSLSCSVWSLLSLFSKIHSGKRSFLLAKRDDQVKNKDIGCLRSLVQRYHSSECKQPALAMCSLLYLSCLGVPSSLTAYVCSSSWLPVFEIAQISLRYSVA